MTLAFISVRTVQQLNALSMQTYMLGAIAGVIFVLAALVVANMIKFEGGANPSDPGKRRLWFWMLLFVSIASFFLYNMFVVSKTVAPNLHTKFMTTNLIGTAVTLISYIIVGFVLSKMFSTGKVGNWFPSKK